MGISSRSDLPVFLRQQTLPGKKSKTLKVSLRSLKKMTQVKCTSEYEQNQNTTMHVNLEPPDQDQIQNVSLFLLAGAPLHSAGAPLYFFGPCPSNTLSPPLLHRHFSVNVWIKSTLTMISRTCLGGGASGLSSSSGTAMFAFWISLRR